MRFLLTCSLAFALLTLGAPVAPAAAGAGCGPSGYGYTGVASADAVGGVGARLSMLELPHVADGHVAAWVGVSSIGTGSPLREWIQVGLSATAGGGSELYLEVARPSEQPLYQALGTAITGHAYRVSVRELAGRRGVWQAFVDEHPVGTPVYLPRSSGRFAGVVTAETWRSGTGCNRFAYRFDRIVVAPAAGADWTALPVGRRYRQPGALLEQGSTDAFIATSD